LSARAGVALLHTASPVATISVAAAARIFAFARIAIAILHPLLCGENEPAAQRSRHKRESWRENAVIGQWIGTEHAAEPSLPVRT
jgi:hypothetical protein